ncbi:AtpZ/AtpI family protein [Candidatus Uhrbacteria bacterium]|nr:AtpZ/AtpI family protein [Candidatus Uhrbacteria bacterium]
MKNAKHHATMSLLGLVGQIGFMVTIPLIGFALLGRMADSTFHSSPLFFLVGVIVSIIASTVLIYRKTSKLMNEASAPQKKQSPSEEHI